MTQLNVPLGLSPRLHESLTEVYFQAYFPMTRAAKFEIRKVILNDIAQFSLLGPETYHIILANIILQLLYQSNHSTFKICPSAHMQGLFGLGFVFCFCFFFLCTGLFKQLGARVWMMFSLSLFRLMVLASCFVKSGPYTSHLSVSLKNLSRGKQPQSYSMRRTSSKEFVTFISLYSSTNQFCNRAVQMSIDESVLLTTWVHSSRPEMHEHNLYAHSLQVARAPTSLC